MTPFTERHATSFLNQLESFPQPLDQALSRYFRTHKSLGSHDRRMMGDAIYTLIRWKGLFDYLYPNARLAEQFGYFLALDVEKLKTRLDIPLALRHGVTPFLYERLLSQYGAQGTEKICHILSTPAPTTIRVNTLKISRQDLIERWKDRFSLTLGELSDTALHFSKREPLFSLPEFKEGYFEMQDEGSQKIADSLPAQPGSTILDYCSGSGGKSLAIAPRMQHKGQLYLHDVRPAALIDAKKRLKRAGIQNAQTLLSDHPQMAKLIGKCDAVLADVPCSGSGTLRRNPDQKWKIDEALLTRLTELQLQIAIKSARYVKKGGTLVYATCSLLKEENEQQVEALLKITPLTLIEEPLTLLPQEKGSDGFFMAKFRLAE